MNSFFSRFPIYEIFIESAWLRPNELRNFFHIDMRFCKKIYFDYGIFDNALLKVFFAKEKSPLNKGLAKISERVQGVEKMSSQNLKKLRESEDHVEFKAAMQKKDEQIRESLRKKNVHPKTNELCENTLPEATSETTLETHLTAREKIIVEIKNNPKISKQELAKVCWFNVDGVRYHIKNLRKLGVLRWVGLNP